ncbi:MAG: hypothetical protein H6553_05670 [Chitinophagales bacterium]|nr:hypothetical protein [Chitinophagales bacterium]
MENKVEKNKVLKDTAIPSLFSIVLDLIFFVLIPFIVVASIVLIISGFYFTVKGNNYFNGKNPILDFIFFLHIIFYLFILIIYPTVKIAGTIDYYGEIDEQPTTQKLLFIIGLLLPFVAVLLINSLEEFNFKIFVLEVFFIDVIGLVLGAVASSVISYKSSNANDESNFIFSYGLFFTIPTMMIVYIKIISLTTFMPNIGFILLAILAITTYNNYKIMKVVCL